MKQGNRKNTMVQVSLKTDDATIAFAYARKEPYKTNIEMVKIFLEEAYNRLEEKLSTTPS